MARIDYKIVSCHYKRRGGIVTAAKDWTDAERQLAELSAQGWDLVKMSSNAEGSFLGLETVLTAVFRRAVPE